MTTLNLVGKDDLTKLKNLGKFIGVEIVQVSIPNSFSSKINSLFFNTKDCIDKFSQTICDTVIEKNIAINIATLEKVKKNKKKENQIVFFVGIPNFAMALLEDLSKKFKCDVHDLILTILIEKVLTK